MIYAILIIAGVAIITLVYAVLSAASDEDDLLEEFWEAERWKEEKWDKKKGS